MSKLIYPFLNAKKAKPRAFDQYYDEPKMFGEEGMNALSRKKTSLGHPISDRTVARLLDELGYSLQSNQKALEGTRSEERNTQFEYINATIKEFQKNNQPVISIDTKKKKLVGNFKNSGQEWSLRGNPRKVNVHDFAHGGERNKAIPSKTFKAMGIKTIHYVMDKGFYSKKNVEELLVSRDKFLLSVPLNNKWLQQCIDDIYTIIHEPEGYRKIDDETLYVH